MKKKLVCLLTAVIVVCSCIGSAFAFDIPDGFENLDYMLSKKPEDVSSILAYPYVVYIKHHDEKGTDFYKLIGFESEPLMSGENCLFSFIDEQVHEFMFAERHGSAVYAYKPANMSNFAFINADYGAEIATNFPLSIIGELNPNMIVHESSAPPSYDLNHDWLSQTTEEGIYIIVPKSGKTFTLKDPAVNITVQYRYGDIASKTGYQHLYASTNGIDFDKITDNDSSLSPFSGVTLTHDEKIVERDGSLYKINY